MIAGPSRSQSARLLRFATLISALAVPGSALAKGPSIETHLACDKLKNVVVCVVRFQPSARAHVTWAEATIVEAPAFVRPLRQRATYTPDRTKLPVVILPFSPTGTGQGEVVVSAQAVVCANDGTSCPSVSKRLRATIRVPAR